MTALDHGPGKGGDVSLELWRGGEGRGGEGVEQVSSVCMLAGMYGVSIIST